MKRLLPGLPLWLKQHRSPLQKQSHLVVISLPFENSGLTLLHILHCARGFVDFLPDQLVALLKRPNPNFDIV
jgi:hypothetical protein